jgi:hypothetical protein
MASCFPKSVPQVKITGVDYGIPESVKISDDYRIIKADINVFSAEDAPYDVVTSLYAMEYADIGSVLSSLRHVAKSGAVLLIFAHSQDSVITAKSENTITFYSLLLSDEFKALLKNSANSLNKVQLQRQIIEHLTKIYHSIDEALQYDLMLVVNRTKQIIERHSELTSMLSELNWYIEQLFFHKERLLLQVAAAKNADTHMGAILQNQATVLAKQDLVTEYGKVGLFYSCKLQQGLP